MKRVLFLMVVFVTILLLVSCSEGKSNNDNLNNSNESGENENDGASEEEVDNVNDSNNEHESAEDETEENNQNENEIEDNEDTTGSSDDEMSEQGDYEVYITGEMVEEDDKIFVEGDSNLLPGARVIGEVSVRTDAVEYRYSNDLEEHEYQADTREIVDEDGSFSMEIDHHGEKDIETFVSVRFDLFEEQDDEIRRHYGDQGENMEGSYIYKYRDEAGNKMPRYIYNRAEAVTSFTTHDDKEIRQFKEPKMGDIPDDMGDTDVWIEVDEFNDDGEYYYVQGKSNLIEGSMIELKRGRKTEAKTLIEQDGTFDFKMPYEEKDYPFVLQFKPFGDQWNIVEKTYGAKGQKLEGELAKGRSHNEEEQYIELEFDDESKEIEVPDNVELDMDGSEAKMLVPDDVLFDYDKSDLKKKSKKTLDDIVKVLDESFNKKDLDIEIAGHTDNDGSTSYNMDLSEDRAESVKKHLEKQIENNDMTLTTKGYADKKPVASNDTDDGQAKNRRVEVIVNLK